MKYVGVDIGGTNLKAGLADENGQLLAVQKMKVASITDQQSLAWTIVSLTQELGRVAGVPLDQIASVGVGVPGTVEIRRISNNLFGTAPEIIRHYIEIRGVGVIDVQQLFGMGAVQFDTEIDLVLQLEQWVDGKFYDRLGLGEEKYAMLGVALPIVTIPVRPGRNLAGIVEIATMKNRQMKYGYNAARDFVTQFDSKVDAMLHGNGAGQP